MRFLLTSLAILGVAFHGQAAAQSTASPHPSLGPTRVSSWPLAATGTPRPHGRPQIDLQPLTPVPGLLAVGALAGAIGLYGGAFAGALIEQTWAPCSCDDPGLQGIFLGAAIGPALTIPLSVHLTNHRRGSFAATMLSSASAGAAGFLISAKHPERLFVGDASPFLVAPIAELVTAVIVERVTSR
jgi:hypothetical protein